MREWNWREHFSARPDTLRYLNHVADKFDLRRDIRFGSRVASAHWDEATGQWTLMLENGETFATRFLFTAVGLHDAEHPGRLGGFLEEAFHTARWPHRPGGFGVSGSGLSAPVPRRFRRSRPSPAR